MVCTLENGDDKQSVMVSNLPLSLGKSNNLKLTEMCQWRNSNFETSFADSLEFDNVEQIIKEPNWSMKLELVLLSSPVKDPSQKSEPVFNVDGQPDEIPRMESYADSCPR